MKFILVDIQTSKSLLNVHISKETLNINVNNNSNVSTIKTESQTHTIHISNIPSSTKLHFQTFKIKANCIKIQDILIPKFNSSTILAKVLTSNNPTVDITFTHPANIYIVNKGFNIYPTILKNCIIESIIIQIPYIFINYLGETTNIEVKSTTTWEIK